MIINYQHWAEFEYPDICIFSVSVSVCLSLPLWVSGWSEAVLWGLCYSADRRQTAPYITTLSVSVCKGLSAVLETGEAVLLYTHAQTHTANSSTPSLSAGKHSRCAPPLPQHTLLLLIHDSMPTTSLCLHHFTFYTGTYLSHFISIPPVLPFPLTQHPFLHFVSLIILILVGPVKWVRQKIQNVCFQTPCTLTHSPCSNLILWCRSHISLDLTSKVMTSSIKGWK